MRKLLSTVAFAAILAAISAPRAEAIEGWYGRVDVGYSVDGEVEDLGTDFDLEEDWMADVGLGYAMTNGFRVEGALDYRTNDVDTLDEEAEVWALMLNAFYDFNRGGGIEPYVGAGVGYARIDFLGDDDENWAWQAQAGIGIPINDRTMFDIGYRYFQIPEFDVGGGDSEYTHQAVTLGLRFQFGAAAPPPPPPLPPPPPPPVSPPPPPVTACPTSEFVVYFEWDRSNLNEAALETIDAAVARAQQCNVNNVLVVGHTDTSGSQEYNEGLSQRRASVVRDALVARGVSANAITTEARGETDLARPTDDGVREPLNRRTAVTITFL